MRFPTNRSRWRQQRLTHVFTAHLRDAARDAGVTVNTMMQAAWAVLLHRYSGESDIVFGATRAGRSTGLPMPTTWSASSSIPFRCASTWTTTRRSSRGCTRCGHSRSPCVRTSTRRSRSVQAWSGVTRGTTLFESAIVYDHQTLDQRMQMPGRHFNYIGQTNFPLALIAYGDDEMLLRLEYSTERFSDAAIERMLAHLVNVLAVARGRTTRPTCAISIRSSAEERAALVGARARRVLRDAR